MNVLVCLLVQNRREFTELTVKFLMENTNLRNVGYFLMVNDNSEDGADEIDWVGEMVDVQAGSVWNSMYLGTRGVFTMDFDGVVFLPNDYILSEGWLDCMVELFDDQDVVSNVDVGEFFWAAPEQVWFDKDRHLMPVSMTGGLDLWDWEVWKQVAKLGYVEKPHSYLMNSPWYMQQRLDIEIGAVCPQLPCFKLDKVLESRYDEYEFYERYGIDKQRIAELVNEYYEKGYCRKRFDGKRILNDY